MPEKKSTADRIIELCNQWGVSIFLDGNDESDAAKIGTPYTFEPNDRILTIYLVNLRSTTWDKIKPFLKGKWDEFGLIIQEKQEQTLEAYIDFKDNHPYSDISDFFGGKIPDKDLRALKLSLFLRSEKEKGKNIDEFKKEIWEKFGERGVYISNLCTSGYFEKDFMPAFKSMDRNKFDRYYELSVGKELKAIFVHSKLKYSSFRDIFEDTLKKVSRYKMGSFYVHGFGSWNVDLINNFFSAYEGDDEGMWDLFDRSEIVNETNPPAIILDIIALD